MNQISIYYVSVDGIEEYFRQFLDIDDNKMSIIEKAVAVDNFGDIRDQVDTSHKGLALLFYAVDLSESTGHNVDYLLGSIDVDGVYCKALEDILSSKQFKDYITSFNKTSVSQYKIRDSYPEKYLSDDEILKLEGFSKDCDIEGFTALLSNVDTEKETHMLEHTARYCCDNDLAFIDKYLKENVNKSKEIIKSFKNK